MTSSLNTSCFVRYQFKLSSPFQIAENMNNQVILEAVLTFTMNQGIVETLLMIADILGMIGILLEAMMNLKEIGKDLFELAPIEMKTMIKDTVMNEILTDQEMNFGNIQEV